MGMEIWEWRCGNGDMGGGDMGMENENGDIMVNRPQNGGMVWGGIQDM